MSALGRPGFSALRRTLWALSVVWAVMTLTFVVSNVLPSDPARLAAGAQARPEDVRKIRSQLGLDQPLPIQYFRYMTRLVHVSFAASGSAEGHKNCGILGPVHVDLGRSYQQRRPVVELLSERLPRSMVLALAAIVAQVAFGLGAALLAARKPQGKIDHAILGASAVGLSFPTFLIGIGLQYLLAHKLGWLPLDGFGWTLAEQARALVLPALTLGLYGAASFVRLARDEIFAALAEDYVRTARAKGASSWRVLGVHALRNAAVPLVSALMLDLGALVGGAIVTESLFRWPGVAALSVSALLDRDGPVLMGTVLVTSLVIVLSNIAADVLITITDPRLRRR